MRINTPTNASAPRSAPKRTPHSAGRGTRHIARLLAAVLGFVVVCADGLGAAAAPLTKKPLNQQDKPLVVVSIGDSYSSGEGLEEFEKEVAPDGDTAEAERIIAHRSLQSWPGLLTFTDASGATVQLKDCFCPQALDDTPGQNVPRTLTGKERRGVYWYSAAASGATTSRQILPSPAAEQYLPKTPREARLWDRHLRRKRCEFQRSGCGLHRASQGKLAGEIA